MKEARAHSQISGIKSISFALFLTICISNTWAQEKATEAVQCDQTNLHQDSKDCKSHKEYKRKQLTTKKISPEIRTEALQRDREFDLNKFYPFLVGSGITN